jgi:hypothetical protein
MAKFCSLQVLRLNCSADRSKRMNHASEDRPVDVAFRVFQKPRLTLPDEFAEATAIAEELRHYLNSEVVRSDISRCHILNASSQQVQAIVEPEATRLGFQSEKNGLFGGSTVSALRPDFYRRTGRSGILLEVERGKTLTNNMDLLDLWKCHVCAEADFLFLIVPVERRSKNATVSRPYDGVLRRLSTFFEPDNYVNVDAVFVFGY